MTEWTEWTSALAVAEALTEWVVDRSPEQWDGENDQRPPVMVLLAHAIQRAARTQELQADHPDQLGQLPLRLIAEHLTASDARALIHDRNDLGPVGGQLGADDLDAVIRTSTQPAPWRDLVSRTAAVVTSHLTASQNTEPRIADRRRALATSATHERRRLLTQLDQHFGEDY